MKFQINNAWLYRIFIFISMVNQINFECLASIPVERIHYSTIAAAQGNILVINQWISDCKRKLYCTPSDKELQHHLFIRALIEAAENNHFEIIEILFSAREELKVTISGDAMYEILRLATKNQNKEIVTSVLNARICNTLSIKQCKKLLEFANSFVIAAQKKQRSDGPCDAFTNDQSSRQCTQERTQAVEVAILDLFRLNHHFQAMLEKDKCRCICSIS